jgi:hypothetical protein
MSVIRCLIDLNEGIPANQLRGARAPGNPGKMVREAGQKSKVNADGGDISIASSVSFFRKRIGEFARIRKGLLPRGQPVLLQKERKNIE